MKSVFTVGCLLVVASFVAATAQAGTVFNNSAQLDLVGNHAAVNFYTSGGGTPGFNTQMTGPIQGVTFTNFDVQGPDGTPKTIGNLTATLPETNGQGRAIDSLTPFVGTAPDTAQAENLATAIAYFSAGQTGSLDFAFGPGLANTVVNVQITGGDEGWVGGTLTASAGGGSGSFTGVGDAATAELMSFLATTDGSGNLNISLAGANTFIGISGVIISTPTPEPSSMILCGLGAIGLFVVARRRRKA